MDSRNRSSFLVLLAAPLVLFACSKSPEQEAGEHRLKAQRSEAVKKYREAGIEYQAALMAYPKDVESLYGLARVLRVSGEPGRYRNALEKVLLASPNHVEACVEMGGLLWAGGAYEKALELADRALQTDPKSLEAKKLRARSFAQLQEAGKARAAWEEILSDPRITDLDYSDAAAFESWQGDSARALETVTAGLGKFATSTKLLLAKASLLLGKKDLVAAEQTLRDALRLAGDDPEVHGVWAKYLMMSGKADEAFRYLAEAHGQFADDPEKSARFTLQRSELCLQAGEIQKAREVLEAERTKQPDHPALAAALADIYITLGEMKRVSPLLDVAKNLDAGNRAAILLATRMYLETGRPLWALQTIETTIARGDMGLDARYLFAKALTGARRWARARWEFIRILRRAADLHMARMDYVGLLIAMGDVDEATKQLDLLPPALSATRGGRLLRTQLAIGKRDPKGAETIVRQLLQEHPDDPYLLLLAADVMRELKQRDEALRFYQKAGELRPTAPGPLLGRAAILEETGEPIRKIFESLIHHSEQYGESVAVFNWMAASSLRRKEYATALKFADRSLIVDPNLAESRLLRGQIFEAMGDEYKAMVDYDQALRLDPMDPRAPNQMARAYRGRGQLDRAEQMYRKMLERNPEDPMTANNLANLCLEQGKIKEALGHAWEAYLGLPKNPYILDTLGWAMHLSGDTASAARYLKDAADALAENPEVLFHWGANLQARGEKAEAKKLLDRVIQLAPQSEHANKAQELLKAGT